MQRIRCQRDLLESIVLETAKLVRRRHALHRHHVLDTNAKRAIFVVSRLIGHQHAWQQSLHSTAWSKANSMWTF